jgi:hypothetical protein
MTAYIKDLFEGKALPAPLPAEKLSIIAGIGQLSSRLGPALNPG